MIHVHTTNDSRETMARPTKHTQELADKICAELAQGYSLRTVCKPEDMPCVATIFNWFRVHPEFLEQYARAKEESADAMAEEILDIADDGTNDWMERTDKNGESLGYQLNGEHVQRSKLRIETRKFLMAKMKPKRYGEKLDLTSSDRSMSPSTLDTSKLSTTTLKELMLARAADTETNE